MKRSPLKRKTPLQRANAGLKRTKAMRRESPKHRERREAWRDALITWMADAIEAGLIPACQVCGKPLQDLQTTHPHHKVLRSKGGKDEPGNLLAAHEACHAWLHDGLTGAQTKAAKLRLAHAALSPASLDNYLTVDWPTGMRS